MPILEVKNLSRFFTLPRIPRPTNLTLKFQYNFFVPDEAVNPDGASIVQPESPTYSYLQKDDDGNSYTVDPITGNKMVYINGKLASGDMISRIYPRTVELEWQMPTEYNLLSSGELSSIQSLEDLYFEGAITYEENISSVYDANVRLLDTDLRDRIYRKAINLGELSPGNEWVTSPLTKAYDSLLHDTDAERSGFVKQGVPGDWHTISLLGKVNTPVSMRKVNDLGAFTEKTVFVKAERHMPDFQYDRRLFTMVGKSDQIKSDLSGRKIRKYADQQQTIISGLPKESQFPPFVGSAPEDYGSTIGDILTDTPYMKAYPIDARILNEKTILGQTKSNQFAVMGYIVERYKKEDLTGLPSRMYFIDSGLKKNMIDVDVVYAEKYYYSVRTVYLREASVEAYDEEGILVPGGPQLIRQYIASRPSLIESVETFETIPPTEPDGIFFKFNYANKRGLMINWQYPVGRSRDTKYFQVFRRSTIHEPFQCIAEIDFNNATVKTARREHVKEENIIKKSGTTTFYEDPDFTRSSSYIYAVAAVDAHGLTSGYSYQTRVMFNKTTNRLRLKSISMAGAPKQYPNFYVDPDEDEAVSVYNLTQDVMTSSGKQRIKLYLDPDCEKYVLKTGESRHLVNLTTGDGENEPVYKMHFINLDRQKDDTLEIRIKDVRKE